jgi:hypothetical protein
MTISAPMTAEQALGTAAAMPAEDWLKIRSGIAGLLAANFSGGERTEIESALAQAQAEFSRGEAIGIQDLRRYCGLQ